MRAASTFFILLVAVAASAADDHGAPASRPALDVSPPPDQALDLSARWRAYEPYDGAGRYTLATDDDVKRRQGLFTLADRFGPKPYGELSTGEGQWQSERAIFRDVDTGATIIRYTNDRFADQLSYFQGNWSADGRYIVFRRRPGMWESSTPTHGPMSIRADGTGLRNVFRDYQMVRDEMCSPVDPNVCYAAADGDRKILAFDMASGKKSRLIREVSPGWHMKISSDGRYLMNRAETSGGKGIWITSVDGQESYEISLPEPIHDSYCFHPSQKKIMFWYEGKFDQGFMQCDFDGSHMTKVPIQYDWNHGAFGLDRGVHSSGFAIRWTEDGWQPKEELLHKPGVESYDNPHSYNGYSSWRPKDRLWSYSTRIVHPPYVSELQTFPGQPAEDYVVNRYRICYTAMPRIPMLDCPNASPDGTKVLYNSTFLGGNNIFGVVARLPEPPLKVHAEPTADGVRLTWQPPAHHAEVAGYHVYGSRSGGTGFLPMTAKPVKNTTVTFKAPEVAKSYFYAVTTVEHGGLESGLSGEANPNSDYSGHRRVFVEVDHARLGAELWVAFHGLASDLHYVWMRKSAARGQATLPLDDAQRLASRSAIVWARVKGRDGAEFDISSGGGDDPAILKSPATADWTWVRAEGTLNLESAKELVLTSGLYGSAIDCLCLTDDENFVPDAAPRIAAKPLAAPQAIEGRALSAYAVRLAWSAATGATFNHYNVYCGASPDVTIGQATLVASPEKPALVDWGLKSGTKHYYRVTCVDRFGRESAASPARMVETPAIQTIALEREFAERVPFEVPSGGEYAVWLLLHKNGDDRGYIDVKCHRAGAAGKATRLATTTGSAAAPALSPVAGGGTWAGNLDGIADSSWLSYDQWGRFQLEPGAYVLEVANKTGSKIEKVWITNDLSLRPAGHVNVLSGW